MQTVEQTTMVSQEAIQTVDKLKSFLEDAERNKYYIAMLCNDIIENRYYTALNYSNLKDFIEQELETAYNIQPRTFYLFAQLAKLFIKFGLTPDDVYKYKFSRLVELMRYLDFLTSQNEKITKSRFKSICSQLQLDSIPIKQLRNEINSLIKPHTTSVQPMIELTPEDVKNIQQTPKQQLEKTYQETFASAPVIEPNNSIIIKENDTDNTDANIVNTIQPDYNNNIILLDEEKKLHNEKEILQPVTESQPTPEKPPLHTQLFNNNITLTFTIDKSVYNSIVKPVFEFIATMTNYQDQESLFLYLCLDYKNFYSKANDIANSA